MYKAVVFDLDGTLLDTLEDLKEALNHTLKMYNFPLVSLKTTKNNIGNGIRKLIERSIDNYEYLEDMFVEFQKYYIENVNVHTKPYPGIVEVLDYLKNNGIKLAVVSNKLIAPLKELCDAHFKGYFDVILGDGMGYKRKPDCEMIDKCASMLNIKASEMIYVGDSNVDVLTSINASCGGVFVSYGFRDKDSLIQAGAKIISDDAYELLEVLKNYE